MAYNDDSVLARLSSLNETHDSIATAAQWIMFHRRHADRTVQLWMQRLKDSSATRRLSLMYLANEVAQQSKIRNKEDFINAFAPVMAEATATAYKGAPAEVQGKLKRVVDVWRDRGIFEAPIIGAIDARINDMDKSKGNGRPGFSGAPFGGGQSIPADFQPSITAYSAVSKLSGPLKSTVTGADQEYEKQMDPSTPQPSAPVYAARLNGLLKTLASAEIAVAECVKARESLVSGLEQLLDSHRGSLDSEKEASARISKRKAEIELVKNEVEMSIMRALGPAEPNGTADQSGSASPTQELERPVMEALTPEMEALTPPSLPEEPQDMPVAESAESEPAGELDSTAQALPVSTNGSNKRRRVDDGYDTSAQDNDDGIDPEVARMLDESAVGT